MCRILPKRCRAIEILILTSVIHPPPSPILKDRSEVLEPSCVFDFLFSPSYLLPQRCESEAELTKKEFEEIVKKHEK